MIFDLKLVTWFHLLPRGNVALNQSSFKAEENIQYWILRRLKQLGWKKNIRSHLHWPISEKIQVHVFSKEVSLWMWCVKFLSSHEEVARKIIPWEREKRRWLTKALRCKQLLTLCAVTSNYLSVKTKWFSWRALWPFSGVLFFTEYHGFMFNNSFLQ